MKYCKDCKHSVGIGEHRKCYAPENMTTSAVSGQSKFRKMEFCENIRENEDECGMDAKWFRQKEIEQILAIQAAPENSVVVIPQPYRLLEKLGRLWWKR